VFPGHHRLAAVMHVGWRFISLYVLALHKHMFKVLLFVKYSSYFFYFCQLKCYPFIVVDVVVV